MIEERCKCCGGIKPNQDNLKLLTLDDVIKFVERVTGISQDRMVNGPKTQDVVRARHMVDYFGYYYTETGIAIIGTQVGQGSHATVLYGAKRTDFNLKTYFEIRHAVNQVMKLIIDGGFKVHRQVFRYSPRELNTNII